MGMLRRSHSDVSDGIKMRLKLSAYDVLRVADQIVSTSTSVHDSAAVPVDQVNYENVIAPLANPEAEAFALVQSCVFPALVSTSKEVRDASFEAEKRIDAYNVNCSTREDVYRVVKALLRKRIL